MQMSELSRISKTSPVGATKWKITLMSSLNAFAKWRRRWLTNFVRFQHVVRAIAE